MEENIVVDIKHEDVNNVICYLSTQKKKKTKEMSVAHKYNRWIITILLRGELLPSKPSIM
jgi:hypothetical protein